MLSNELLYREEEHLQSVGPVVQRYPTESIVCTKEGVGTGL
jgi:hypothetical protein